MSITFTRNGKTYQANDLQPVDLSLPVADLTRAWYINPPKMQPVVLGDWVGSVEQGGSVNFRNITFNPHAHCTHTECLGHVTKEVFSVNQVAPKSWLLADLISVTPQDINGDLVITFNHLKEQWPNSDADALIMRTMPNNPQKATANQSNTNWPFLHEEAAVYIRERGIKHLLIDQPSVDKEEDGGALLAHKAFWNLPAAPRKEATITELIFVPQAVKDGLYVLNLQVAPLENDAAPSRPLIFPTTVL